MLQVKQNLHTGATELADVPAPAPGRASVSIRTAASLISAGTERMLLEFGKASYLDKARQQPDQIRKVLDKVKTDGLVSTIESVRSKLDQPIAPGYCNAGVVLSVGSAVTRCRPGQRVVSNGAHAEVVSVPANLCATIPDSVSDSTAAFTVVGAIALQGIRLAEPTLGETVVVTGLGLIGLIAVQLLRAHGCRVLGIDFDPRKIKLAQSFGAETVDLSIGEDPILAAERFSRGRGVDAVLVTASTKSNEPVHQAALMCRKRGRIVLVGVTGLELSRDDFYKKELSFQVSCSYGPGRYDPSYEQAGNDYPYSHVRWTAQRNFEAVLDMLADGRLNVEPLITHRFAFNDALEAYNLLSGDEPYLGIILEYPQVRSTLDVTRQTIPLLQTDLVKPGGSPALAFIGAGAYASKVLMPAFKSSGATFVSVASKGGLSAAHAGSKFGFAEATTDVDSILGDARVNTVVIATQHDSHASLVCRSLSAGKHVFVEKPLALKMEDIEEIEQLYSSLNPRPIVMVGFNRRFSPHSVKAKSLLSTIKGPKSFVYTVNAGMIPPDHWTQNPEIGGGRILGEACHFIDLIRFLADSPTLLVSVNNSGSENVAINLAFQDGSIGTVHYLTSGHKSFPKERLEVFAGGRILVIDNFRRMRGFGWPRFSKMNLWSQDKGAAEMARSFINAVREGACSPIPFAELVDVSRATLHSVA